MTDSFASILLSKLNEEIKISYNSLSYLLFGFYLISLSLFLYSNKNTSFNHDFSRVYGLFLILFAIPIFIPNKQPIFQIKRNILTFIIGLIIEIIGIILCLIPNIIKITSTILLGVLLFFGSITLLSKLFLEEPEKNPMNMENKITYIIIYLIAGIIGANNMFNAGLDLNIVILLYSLPFFYLANKCIDDAELKDEDSEEKIILLKPVSLELESILALILGIFAIVSGIIMSYFNIASISGITSITLLILSIQAIFKGISPIGILDRKIWLYLLGFIGLLLSMISCLIPNILNLPLIYIVGILNMICIFQVIDLIRLLNKQYNTKNTFKFTISTIGMICSILQNIIMILFGMFIINQTLISPQIMGILLIVMGLDILVMIFLNEKK